MLSLCRNLSAKAILLSSEWCVKEGRGGSCIFTVSFTYSEAAKVKSLCDQRSGLVRREWLFMTAKVAALFKSPPVSDVSGCVARWERLVSAESDWFH